jgi:hypothetical protein
MQIIEKALPLLIFAKVRLVILTFAKLFID